MTSRKIVLMPAALILTAMHLAQPVTAQPKNSPPSPTKSECIDANTAGQSHRLAGQLDEARKDLTLCSDAACPALVRSDCTQRLDEIARIQPTLVLGVKDASGADVTNAKVTIDGKPFADHLDGSAIPVNPGEHVFVFTISGESPVTRKLVIKEGEKGRLEQISLGSDSASGSNGSGLGAQKLIGISGVALGGVGLALGSVFGVMAISAADQQTTNCPSTTNCPNREEALANHATAEKMGTASTIAFVGGGALVVTGVILLLTAPTPPKKAANVKVMPTLSAQGSGVVLFGHF